MGAEGKDVGEALTLRCRHPAKTREKDVPESPLGIGDAEGLEPPKRPLRMLAMVAVGDGWLAGCDELSKGARLADNEAASL